MSTGPPSRAVIDIGSNSVKCVVAKGFGSASQVIRELSRVTRLGEELAGTGKIGAESSERNLGFISEIRETCIELGVSKVLCVGAETLRRAEDAELFASRLEGRTGWRLRILTQQEEARLSFEAASDLAPPDRPCLVIDSGGGSTEFSFGFSDEMESSHSLPLGALTLTRQFISGDPASVSEVKRLREYVRSLLENTFPQPETLPAIACGGGVNALASVALALEPYDAELVQGFWLSRQEIKRQIGLYASTTELERRLIKGLPPGREGIILAGALIMEGIVEHFNLEGFLISSQGIRHALLEEKYRDWFQPF